MSGPRDAGSPESATPSPEQEAQDRAKATEQAREAAGKRGAADISNAPDARLGTPELVGRRTRGSPSTGRGKAEKAGQRVADWWDDERPHLEAQARREGQRVAEHGRGAHVPEASIGDAAPLAEAGSKAVTMLAELAGKYGVAMVGVASTGMIQGYEIVHAFNEMHEAHAKETVALGVRHGISVIADDSTNPDDPHIRDGSPYTPNELRKRVGVGALASDRRRWMATLAIGNTAESNDQYQRGVDWVVTRANAALRAGRSPQERQMVMQAFVGAANQAMAPSRRAWQERADALQERANARVRRYLGLE